ncbi:MAG: DEAD/DEAH box helicase [Bacteroidaceae bacterium]
MNSGSNLTINQSLAFHHLKEWKVGALFMEAGTGKTRVAVDIVNDSPCDRIFWIGPFQTLFSKTGKTVQKEIDKWGGFKMPVSFYGIESISSSDRIYFELLDEIDSSETPFLLIDESIKIKNAMSKRTKRMLEASKKVEYKLILNGTPLTRNVMDLWSQIEFLSPKILNMSYRHYKETFCQYLEVKKKVGFRTYRKEIIKGFDNIDYLYSLIQNYIYECDLSLECMQNYKSVYYSISEDEREKYEGIKEKFLTDEMLEWRNNNIFFAMTQKMQHSYCCSLSKFEALERLFESLNPKDCLIFCKYIDSYQACKKHFPNALVLSYQKEALGLNLQDYSNTIYFDKVWDYALRVQSTRRTFRTGQKQDCKYYDLTGNVGLESLIDRNISKKISMTEYFKSISKKQLLKEL